jgi:hypothetical protein
MADEVPLEAVAEGLLLADEVLRPVLSQQIGACLRESGDLDRLVILAGDKYPRVV